MSFEILLNNNYLFIALFVISKNIHSEYTIRFKALCNFAHCV